MCFNFCNYNVCNIYCALGTAVNCKAYTETTNLQNSNYIRIQKYRKIYPHGTAVLHSTHGNYIQ